MDSGQGAVLCSFASVLKLNLLLFLSLSQSLGLIILGEFNLAATQDFTTFSNLVGFYTEMFWVEFLSFL